ncbi:N-acetylmuramoyl-L-alanine amidase [Roseovarius sp. MMSF_3359]|uniref:N-acetylmuramoyl-L-alanine amidase n=1 Tax=unclassified Roseovarius TaxID=2614913 RepID=UPI003531D5FB
MPDIEQYPSPNCGARRDGARPDMIVLHYTAMATAEAARDRLCDPEAEVSSHYLIAENGHIWQLVPEEQRAWHAGAGQWGDVSDVNSRSIGIELANRGDHPFSEPQMAALERLMAQIMMRWSIVPERVIGHSDMAIGRKSDPGPRFDWQRLALQGLAVWPESGACAGDFATDARAFGYPSVGAVDELLAAVRLRFRPWAKGPLDEQDRALMHDLASRYPVDRKAFTA